MKTHSKIVLVIEDDKAHSSLIKTAFESTDLPQAFNLLSAKNLIETRKYLKDYSLDLLITDQQLPDGKGTDLLTFGGRHRNFPVVIMTSHGNEVLAVKAIKQGALDYVVKSEDTLRTLPERSLKWIREWQFMVENRNQEIVAIKKQLALEESNKELEHFASIASHDLQEPLSTVTSMIQLIREDDSLELNDDCESNFLFIDEAIVRMRQLIKDLLNYSRLGGNRELSGIDVADIIMEVKKDLSKSIQSKKAIIKIDNMPIVQGFAMELRLLFQNIISNALKFIRPTVQPYIQISSAELESHWKFTVKDNGIGIKQKDLEKIFVIFQRLNNDSSYKGTGIGLSHCKKIVKIHNGSIWVESTYGSGSTFNFTISKNLLVDKNTFS